MPWWMPFHQRKTPHKYVVQGSRAFSELMRRTRKIIKLLQKGYTISPPVTAERAVTSMPLERGSQYQGGLTKGGGWERAEAEGRTRQKTEGEKTKYGRKKVPKKNNKNKKKYKSEKVIPSRTTNTAWRCTEYTRDQKRRGGCA